jgi:G3E family GTPase
MSSDPTFDNRAAIDLVVICGFLGSGKTTVLRRLAQRHGGRRLLFLVNDFSTRDVDGARLELPEDALATVAGGSVFCRCRSGELVAILQRIAALATAPDAVVIEASGIADPRNLALILAEHGLTARFRYRRCCCLVDPVALLKLRHTLPVVRDQLAAASLVVINRCDTADARQLAECRDFIGSLRPDVPVEETCFGQLATDLLAGIDSLPATAPGRTGAGPFASVDCAIPGPVDWPRLRAAIDALGGRTHRVKGRIPASAGPLEVDWTYSGWQEHPMPPDGSGTGVLVIITDHPTRPKAQRLVGSIAAGDFAVET